MANRVHRAAAISIALFLALLPSWGAEGGAARSPSFKDSPLPQMPDSSGLRSRYWSGYFSAPLRSASRSESIQRDEKGSFKFSFVDGKDYFYQIVSPLPEGADAKAPVPLYRQGTWILKRSKKTGLPVQAKVFLRSDPGCFARIYPDADRSRLDLVVYGGVLEREVALPFPFERAFASSLAEILRWTEEVIDWSILSPRPASYEGARRLAAAIRERLPSLRYVDDGALDARGRPVLIASGEPQAGKPGLNCSGFAKWVVDGFYGPLTGAYLDPKAMAERRDDSRADSYSEAVERTYDPYFGLDWTRNLSVALADAVYPARAHGLKEADVSEAPFAQVALEPPAGAVNGSSSYDDYPAPEENLGYQGPGLQALLYCLASADPGSFYLASLSRRGGGKIDGLLSHYHVAVLVPYFEEGGAFKVAVFESAAETSLAALVGRVGKDYIHLSRLPILPDFDPPRLP